MPSDFRLVFKMVESFQEIYEDNRPQAKEASIVTEQSLKIELSLDTWCVTLLDNIITFKNHEKILQVPRKRQNNFQCGGVVGESILHYQETCF